MYFLCTYLGMFECCMQTGYRVFAYSIDVYDFNFSPDNVQRRKLWMVSRNIALYKTYYYLFFSMYNSFHSSPHSTLFFFPPFSNSHLFLSLNVHFIFKGQPFLRWRFSCLVHWHRPQLFKRHPPPSPQGNRHCNTDTRQIFFADCYLTTCVCGEESLVSIFHMNWGHPSWNVTSKTFKGTWQIKCQYCVIKWAVKLKSPISDAFWTQRTCLLFVMTAISAANGTFPSQNRFWFGAGGTTPSCYNSPRMIKAIKCSYWRRVTTSSSLFFGRLRGWGVVGCGVHVLLV